MAVQYGQLERERQEARRQQAQQQQPAQRSGMGGMMSSVANQSLDVARKAAEKAKRRIEQDPTIGMTPQQRRNYEESTFRNAHEGRSREEQAAYERDIRLEQRTGPSQQREIDLHNRDFRDDKPYIRPVDPTAYQEQLAQEEARRDLNQLGSRYAEDRQAPQSGPVNYAWDDPVNVNPAAMRAAVKVGKMDTYKAAQAGPINVGQMQTYDAARRDRTTVGPMSTYDAALSGQTTLAPATMASAAGVDSTSINRADDQQLRAGQLAQVGRLSSMASGEGPSMAGATLQKGTSAALAGQIAAAASQRGSGGVGGLNRQLANTGTQLAAQAAGKAAELKVAEQLAAEQQLTGALSGARGQDIGVAQFQAQLSASERSQASAQQQQVNLANQAAENDRNLQQGLITAEEHSRNQAAINAQRSQLAQAEQGRTLAQAELDAAAAAGDQDAINAQRAQYAAAVNQGILSQADVDLALATGNRDAINAQLSQHAAAKNQGTLAQAQIDADKAAADQEATNRLNEMFLDRDSQARLAQLDVDSRINLANLEAQLRTMGMDDAVRQNIMQMELNQANVLAAQGIAYDQAAVARSIVRHAAGQAMESDMDKFMATAMPIIGMAAGGASLLYNTSRGQTATGGQPVQLPAPRPLDPNNPYY